MENVVISTHLFTGVLAKQTHFFFGSIHEYLIRLVACMVKLTRFLSFFCLEIRLSVIEMHVICSSTWTSNRYIYITSQARITQALLLALLAFHRVTCKTNPTPSYLYVRRNHFHCSEESPVDIHIIHGQADLAFSGARMSSPVGKCCIQPRTMTSAKAECDASRACLSS